MITIQYAGEPENWEEYAKAIPENLAKQGVECRILQDIDPAEVDYIVYAASKGPSDFTPYTNLKAVLSLWAGVERIEGNKTLTMPLCRMVDDGLRDGMREWVAGHILRHHLGLDGHVLNQDGVWRHVAPPLARQKNVGILGIGELGQACAATLNHIGFNVMGWSRSLKEVDNVTCYAGKDGLHKMLEKSDFVVLLLPQTPETCHILNAETLAILPKGAFILNPGRGPLIDDDALLDALNSGHIAHATLDVFDVEPLPEDHIFWQHEKVTVTPHIASDTRSETAALVIADNIIRSENGRELLYQVDRKSRY